MIQPNNYRIDEAKYKSLLKYIRLSVTEKYEFPQEIVQIDGVTIATIGNFSFKTIVLPSEDIRLEETQSESLTSTSSKASA